MDDMFPPYEGGSNTPTVKTGPRDMEDQDAGNWVKLDPFDSTLLGKGIPNFALDPKFTPAFPPLPSGAELDAINKSAENLKSHKTYTRSVFYDGKGLENGYDPNAAWIQTHSGRRFNPTQPNPDAIVIQDIAHALSMQCRFSGHSKKFYCVTPETKILTSRLTWVEAGLLKIGDGLVAFDEYPVKMNDSKNRNRRKLCFAKVLHDGIIRRIVYKITLSDGSVIRSSAEHPWLISTKISRNQVWKTTQEIAEDIEQGHKRYMLKFLEPWSVEEESYARGYLEGILDGESYVSFNRYGSMVGISQNPGKVLDKIKSILIQDGITFTEVNSGNYKTKTCQLTGSWYQKLRFLGRYQPVRLLDNFERFLMDGDWRKEFDSIALLQIEKVECEGMQDVVALETSSKTYFANGFGAHNSVAQHSVLVSYICDHKDAMWGLLHDASEAYLVDVPRPLKRSGLIQGYIDMENKMQEAICRRFALPFAEPASVKAADTRLLSTEARDLMSPLHSDWQQPVDPLPFKIEPWDHNKAKDMFMKRFFELFAGPEAGKLHYEHYLKYRDVL